MMEHLPLHGLVLRTPRLELRLPTLPELNELAEVAAGGVHAPDVMPFVVAWTDQPAAEVVRSVVRQHWRALADWTHQEWALPLTVRHDGVVVGQQIIAGRSFAVTREVRTDSWLGLRHHGQGIGTEMRAAVLHLGFVGLAAVEATSVAFTDNAASLAVSRKLGYQPDGIGRRVARGRLAIDQRLRLTRAAWEAHRSVPVTIEGLDPCLPLFDAAH